MEPRRRKLIARLLLGGGVAGCVAWLLSLDYQRQIATDVLELLPADERQPELALVRSLANQQQARAAWFVLEDPTSSDAKQLARVGAAFVAALRASPAFADVVAIDDAEFRDALGKFFFEHRFELLLPEWLAQGAVERPNADGFSSWLAERTAAELEEFLQRPDALAFERVIPRDPLLLIPRLMDATQGLSGAEFAETSDQVRIWAELAASPMTEAGQEPVFAAVESALSAARTIAPGIELRWTSVARFAAESRTRIQAELSVLNVAALLAVFIVAALCLHRVWQMLHLVPGVVCSFLGAWTVTTLVYDRVHVLVFVIGSLLGGIASDYGLHVYLHAGRPGEDFSARLRAVRRPLIGSALTAMIGFSALFFSDLPLLRQVGVFVLSGLVAAMLGALLWFAQVREPQGALRARIQHGLLPSGRRGLGIARWITATLVVAIAGAGSWRVTWRDDIRELEIRVPELWTNDREVRATFGETPGQHLFLVRGDSPAEARTALAQFADWLRQHQPDATVSSVGLALPSAAAWAAMPAQRERLQNFDRELRVALERHGFEAREFAPFFDVWREFWSRKTRPVYEELQREFFAALRGPASMLLSTEPGASWFAVAVDEALARPLPPELPVVAASQLESLNHVFGSYRSSALRLSLVGLAAASASVLLVYGLRNGPRMLLIPLGACVGAFGALGLVGAPLNLFHLLGAFLGLCLCFDYAIFSGDRAARGERGAPPSVRLSAFNTIASFGVLAFSRIPVVSALGTTVALIALVALVMVELDFFRRER